MQVRFLLERFWISNVVNRIPSMPSFVPTAMMLRPTNQTPVATTPTRPKVLVITGPTAVGKSATAMKICKELNGEIVSADSVQVYRHLNIGSNKASLDDRAAISHHMIDIADPSKGEFSAGHFFRAARAAIEDVLERGRVPVVVGGTMMYVRWLIYGRPATPRAEQSVKEKVSRIIESLNGDWEAAVTLLAQRDQKRASELSKNDWYRLGRALEVLESTGVAMTDMPLQGGAPRVDKTHDKLDYDFRCVFMYGDRIRLNRKIDERCEEMILPRISRTSPEDFEAVFKQSILPEVAFLLSSKGLRVASASPCYAIGYRQTISYLTERAISWKPELQTFIENGDNPSTEAVRAFRNFVDEFQAATRGYGKQQMSWFRKETRFQWVKAGSDSSEVISHMLSLDERGYNEQVQECASEQVEMRQSIVAQGKDMKRYISEKLWLKNDSIAEKQAVILAERCARDMAVAVSQEELDRILSVIAR